VIPHEITQAKSQNLNGPPPEISGAETGWENRCGISLSRNHRVGREMVAKQIFAQGEECGARIFSVDL
jgi:hypothetical protein